MDYRFRISQDEMKRLYENAKERKDLHPEFADKYNKAIREHPFFKSEKEALEAVLKLMDDKGFSNCQIWAMIEKDGDIYRIKNWWLVTDDNIVKLAAEYIGMALMYDDIRIQNIISNNIKVEDVIAYY